MMFANLIRNKTYYGNSVNLVVGLGPLTKTAPLSPINRFTVFYHYRIFDYLATRFNIRRYF